MLGVKVGEHCVVVKKTDSLASKLNYLRVNLKLKKQKMQYIDLNVLNYNCKNIFSKAIIWIITNSK